QRLGEQRQPRHDRRRRLLQQAAEEPLEAIGIAVDDHRAGKARLQQPAEGRIELDQHQPRRIDPLRHQRLGHWPSAGPQLDDRPGHIRIDIARHGTRQRLARGRDRARGQRLLDPGAEEADVVELRAVLLRLEAADLGAELLLLLLDLLLETLDVRLEPLLERVLLLLEDRDLAINMAAELALLQDEQAALLFDFPLETLQGW